MIFIFDEWFRFHKNEFNEMPCKLESTENRSRNTRLLALDLGTSIRQF